MIRLLCISGITRIENNFKASVKELLLIIILLMVETSILFFLKQCILMLSHRQSELIENNLKIHSIITEDMQYFPIPLEYRSEVTYEDSYGAFRNNGGHEGCDIMDTRNEPGRIPIISATDGTVTNIGWLFLGGYRVGITSDNGVYYYYAHLDSYAAGIEKGDRITAGQFIGFMGNTGEGIEGTSGNFPVHLHFGIYTGVDNGEEQAVNSYPYLTGLE